MARRVSRRYFPIPAGRLCDPRSRLIHVCLYTVLPHSSGAAAQATGAKSAMFHESRREQRIMFWKESHLGSLPLIPRVIYLLG